jgi:anti-anti-sigma regulatory factor
MAVLACALHHHSARTPTFCGVFKNEGDEAMPTSTTTSAHIAYEMIDNPKHQVVVVEFRTREIAGPSQARELGQQLHSLINPRALQYFVIDCAGVRSLGSTAFSEIMSFVEAAKPVWLCNLTGALRIGAALVGLDSAARFAANRRAAVKEAELTARYDQEETVDNSA